MQRALDRVLTNSHGGGTAWEAHTRVNGALARDHERTGTEGLDDEQAAAARRLAGRRDADA